MANGVLGKVEKLAAKAIHGLEKEREVLQTLDEEVEAAMDRLDRDDPGLKSFLHHAHGYAVFPSVGQAAAVIGGVFGKGEVFERGKLAGYAGLIEVTLGLQLGGQTFTQFIAFEDKPAFERFKQRKFAITAQAAAALVGAGAAATTRYDKGVAVFMRSEGGLLGELSLAAQKFVFAPAVMGRGIRH